jgi:alkylhydroperoxidase family enzyme
MVSQRYQEFVDHLRQAVLAGPGVTERSERAAVASRAGALSGGGTPAEGVVPGAIAGFVDKVAGRAYTVTDDDVHALRQAGYSEDAIFEITASAAMGAALGRLERGLAALRGEV